MSLGRAARSDARDERRRLLSRRKGVAHAPMDRCSVATGPLDRRFTSRGRGREAVTPRAALGHRTNRSVPGLRRGKMADGRNNFGLWQSALGHHSQEETELREGDSTEPFKQRKVYENWRDWNWRYWCSDCQKV